ncbi:MAG: cobyrinate a,c-diamide synthase [Pleurocapsa sp.]
MIIAGDRSGVGKTTITLAILAFLSQRGDRVQSFKVGPDYIDPMFHTAITARPCRNLDPILTSEDYVRSCLARHANGVDWVVIEGVMGLFDGIGFNSSPLNDYASTAHIARLLKLPVVLVLDCSRLSTSIAAIAYGYAHLDPQVKVAGVILNKVASDRHLELLKTALDAIAMPILGVLRRDDNITIPDRHLGLIPSEELPQLDKIFTRLADIGKTCLNWKLLFPLLRYQPSTINHQPSTINHQPSTIKIAIARDRAFNFYYQDNLDILTELGAELIFWSPLEATKIPADIHGLYFGGGFPEVFAQQLSENQTILQQLKEIILGGIPTYAECGGLMYLCDRLIDLNEQTWSMVGTIPAKTVMEKSLTLGYRQATALQSSPVINKGQTVRGHEFHRSQIIINPQNSTEGSLWEMKGFHRSSKIFSEGWQSNQLHASYLHLHFGASKFLAQNFLQCCRNYQSSLY